METLLPLIIQAVSGAAGGGVVGSLMKQAAMTLLPKLLSGAIGGVAGGSILGAMLGGDPTAMADAANAAEGLDLGALLVQVAGGAAGGGVLTAIVGAVMGAMKR